jgi:SAM-dependent methyltransferase
MSIRNLDARKAYWNDNYTPRQQGDSIACPFKSYIELFIDKDVLELGPGGGRQTNIVIWRAKSYAIADIAKRVLSEQAFKNVPDKFLITDYKQKLGKTFDVIHFWYVIHHMLLSELPQFCEFLFHHLRLGGLLLFNIPYLGCDPIVYGEDGMHTSAITVEQIECIFSPRFELVVNDQEIQTSSTAGVLVFRRRVVACDD